MPQRAFGTHDIARVCHVSPPTVGRWIEEGLLPSFTTGGGHRRVWDVDLRAFLITHNIPLPSELAEAGPPRVLLVDDEPHLCQMMARVLKKHHPIVELREAHDGFEAGRAIAEWKPTLVILDVMLPGLNGLNVCETVKKDPLLSGVRVLVISGQDVEKARAAWRAAGADGFLAKPFRPEELIAEITKLLPTVFGGGDPKTTAPRGGGAPRGA